MGFFSNIFKKKKGGTLVGNLLRGGASAFTGGLLGSGAGLSKWEQEQAAKEQEAQFNAYMATQKPNNGYQIGQNIVNGVAVPAMADGGQNQPKAGESIVLYTLKKWWWAVLLGVAALIGITYYISKPKGKKARFK